MVSFQVAIVAHQDTVVGIRVTECCVQAVSEESLLSELI